MAKSEEKHISKAELLERKGDLILARLEEVLSIVKAINQPSEETPDVDN